MSLPTLINPAMPSYTGLVIDKDAIVSAVGPVKVASSEHAMFSSDSTPVRCTFRFGANTVRPDRVGKFTIAAAGS